MPIAVRIGRHSDLILCCAQSCARCVAAGAGEAGYTLNEHEIENTVVMFGSARILDAEKHKPIWMLPVKPCRHRRRIRQ